MFVCPFTNNPQSCDQLVCAIVRLVGLCDRANIGLCDRANIGLCDRANNLSWKVFGSLFQRALKTIKCNVNGIQ